MDCLAVSIAQGLSEGRWERRALVMALLFGLFQGGMPLIGYLAGTFFAGFFSRFAPWVALILLSIIGGKMVWEGWRGGDDEVLADWSIVHLLVLAVATSIDALSTGVIFIPYPESLLLGVSLIGIISLVGSLVGYLIGVFVGRAFRLNVEVLGGMILIGIGLKIFLGV